MHILTGFVFCVFALSFICVGGSEEGSAGGELCEWVCAASLLLMVLLAGHWITMLLGRL